MSGFNLPEARINAGLSIRGLSRALDIPESTIRSIENGKGRPRPATAKKIADHFGVKVTDIIPVDEAAA